MILGDWSVWQRLCTRWPTGSRERKRQETAKDNTLRGPSLNLPMFSEPLQRAPPAGDQVFKHELWKHFIFKPLTESKEGSILFHRLTFT